MYEDIITECRSTMTAAIESLKGELSKIRTGRANPALLDRIRVDY